MQLRRFFAVVAAIRLRQVRSSESSQVPEGTRRYGAASRRFNFLRGRSRRRYFKNEFSADEEQKNSCPRHAKPLPLRGFSGNLGDLCAESGQTLQGSLSAVSKPKFAFLKMLQSYRRNLHTKQSSKLIILLKSLNCLPNLPNLLNQILSKFKGIDLARCWPSSRECYI